VFIEAKDDGGGGDNWTTGDKSCKSPALWCQYPNWNWRLTLHVV